MTPVKKLIITAVIAFVVITVFSLWSSQPEVKAELTNNSGLSYKEQIDSLRRIKHTFMASDEDSPFITQKASFDSLRYFPIDEQYKVTASVELINEGEVFPLQTSDNQIQKYQEVALLHFDIAGSHQDLTLLQSTNREHYFLPFYDETSALSTYGAGRYLEVAYSGEESSISLDFNMAYNPYCAYVDGYSCPVPPAKNQLKVAIEAGEKNYSK